jgi:molybdate transport system substrate-binding protein
MRTTTLTSLLLLLAAGCWPDPGPAPASAAAAPAAMAPAGPHTLVVFATASLRAPFTELARRYEAAHPGAKVELLFDGGTQILNRMIAGEKCDVVAIGDSSAMSRFAAAALLAPRKVAELARNRIALAVTPGNPKNVCCIHDLKRADVRVALGAISSSIGRHARWALSRSEIDVKPVLEGKTADEVVAAVAAGKADAGVVYATSFAGAAGVDRVDVPEALNTPVLYSIAVAREAKQPDAGHAFYALALGETGQSVLHDAGFLPIGAK